MCTNKSRELTLPSLTLVPHLAGANTSAMSGAALITTTHSHSEDDVMKMQHPAVHTSNIPTQMILNCSGSPAHSGILDAQG